MSYHHKEAHAVMKIKDIVGIILTDPAFSASQVRRVNEALASGPRLDAVEFELDRILPCLCLIRANGGLIKLMQEEIDHV